MQQASTAAAPAVADAPTSSTESTASLEQIATGLATSMPEVQEHAVTQATREQQEAEANPRDDNGDAFDPAIHVTGPDGKGVRTVSGAWARKRGRKVGKAANAHPQQQMPKSSLGGNVVPMPSQAQPNPQQVQEGQARAAGVAAAELLFMLGQMIGGEEWAPMENKTIGLDERPLMHKAFGDYFVATGKTDIPPGMALTVCIIGYAAPRFAMPKTQTRFGKIKAAITQWWVNRKLRKAGMEATVQAKPAESEKK